MKALVAFGSNLGDRRANLDFGARALSSLPEVSEFKTAPVIENHALTPKGSPPEWNRPFLNSAARFEWSSGPKDLLRVLKRIEVQAGRVPSDRWAPRSLDLDLISLGDLSLQDAELVLPHPRAHERAFVTEPAKFLDPRFLARSRSLEEHHPLWMGILNLTGDSFSGDGRTFDLSATGLFDAHIWDLGAESTRPGAVAVGPEEEWRRLAPAMERLRELRSGRHFAPLVSVDTRHAATAARAIEAGADILNDVSGLSDPRFNEILCSAECDYVLMHSLSVPADPQQILARDADPVREILAWSEAKLEVLERAGVARSRVILDPGIGFGKTAVQSMEIMKRIAEFHRLEVRLLVGHSRKSFLSQWTKEPFGERDPETLGISLALADRGVDIIRVHAPKLHARARLAQMGVRL